MSLTIKSYFRLAQQAGYAALSPPLPRTPILFRRLRATTSNPQQLCLASSLIPPPLLTSGTILYHDQQVRAAGIQQQQKIALALQSRLPQLLLCSSSYSTSTSTTSAGGTSSRNSKKRGRGQLRAITPSDPHATSLIGVVSRVLYRSRATGYTAVLMQDEIEQRPVTAVGPCHVVAPGERLALQGRWARGRRHGWEFVIEEAELAELHQSVANTAAYVQHIGKGLGQATASALETRFGKDLMSHIAVGSDALLKVRGIGHVRRDALQQGWSRAASTRELELFFANDLVRARGWSPELARRVCGGILRRHQDNPMGALAEDPAILFSAAPMLHLRMVAHIVNALGVSDAEEWLRRSALHLALARAAREGHTGLPYTELLARARTLHEGVPTAVDRDGDCAVRGTTTQETRKEKEKNENEMWRDTMSADLENGSLVLLTVNDQPCIFPRETHERELNIATRLDTMARAQPPWDYAEVRATMDLLETTTFLSPSQLRALHGVARSKVAVLTGGPGVGKTTVLQMMANTFKAMGLRVVFTAPTGRAARRMKEATTHEATTVHRLLRADRDGTCALGPSDPVAADVVVVDEASMLDVTLTDILLSALPPHAALVLVGDADQLPPVGPGSVLQHTVAAGTVPTFRLTEIHRQREESGIVAQSRALNVGELPKTASAVGEGDFVLLEERPERVAARVAQLVEHELPKYLGDCGQGGRPFEDVHVLCPMRTRGSCAAHALNERIQRARWSLVGASAMREAAVWTRVGAFAPGDRVMQTVNSADRDVYNGEIGIVLEPRRQGRGRGVCGTDSGSRRSSDRATATLVGSSSFGDAEIGASGVGGRGSDLPVLEVAFADRTSAYTLEEAEEELSLAHAMTVHKAQGCEVPAVVVPLVTEHAFMLSRQLLYTAVTRARVLVILVGERAALELAVARAEERSRCTGLETLLRARNNSSSSSSSSSSSVSVSVSGGSGSGSGSGIRRNGQGCGKDEALSDGLISANVDVIHDIASPATTASAGEAVEPVGATP